jgi:hypothetical protein
MLYFAREKYFSAALANYPVAWANRIQFGSWIKLNGYNLMYDLGCKLHALSFMLPTAPSL